MGQVAYRLDLPPNSKLHPTFHVSLLKKRIGSSIPVAGELPQFDQNGEITWEPLRVLNMGTRKERGRTISTWLVQWKGLLVEDATWEDAHKVLAAFPAFDASGQVAS